MTCGQRISTPYGMGIVVALRGNESVIVGLDDGDYVEVGVESVNTWGYTRSRNEAAGVGRKPPPRLVATTEACDP